MATFNEATIDDEWWVFQLFRYGPINLFYRGEILNETIQHLERHKYIVHEFDCQSYKSDDALLWDVGSRLGFPYAEGWTPGLDGFNDFLGDVEVPDESGLILVLKNFDSYYREFASYANSVLSIFAGCYHQNLLFGLRFAVLIQSNDPRIQIEPVGGFKPCWNGNEWTTTSRTS